MAYSFIPAAMTDIYYCTLYVKWKPRNECWTSPFKYESSNVKKGLDKVELPDRIIYVRRTANPEAEPPQDTYSIYYLDPFMAGSVVNYYLDWVLVSAHYAQGSTINWFANSGLKVLMDSGGAQLKFRTASYVDPKAVIATGNQFADVLMALDVAPKPGVDDGNLAAYLALSKAQKKNTDLFLDQKRESLIIMNVLHGTTLEEGKTWADTVIDPRCQGWAIGCDNFNNFSCVFRMAALLYKHYGLKDNPTWVHLFGWTGAKVMPAIAWLGKYLNRLTSDSSSFLEGARRAAYFHHDTSGLMSVDHFGSKMRNANHAVSSVLPCSCPICSAIRFVGVYTDRGEASAVMPLVLHNMIAFRESARLWSHLADIMTYKDFFEFVKHTASKKAANILQYVEIAMNDGPEVADREMPEYLDYVDVSRTRPTLFGKVGNKESNTSAEILEKYLSPEEIDEAMGLLKV